MNYFRSDKTIFNKFWFYRDEYQQPFFKKLNNCDRSHVSSALMKSLEKGQTNKEILYKIKYYHENYRPRPNLIKLINENKDTFNNVIEYYREYMKVRYELKKETEKFMKGVKNE